MVVTDLNFPSDDFQALSLLLGMPEVDVVHIVATDGNTWAEEVRDNVAAVLSAHGRTDIPITLFPAAFRYERRSRAVCAYRQRSKSFIGPYAKSLRPRVLTSSGDGEAHPDDPRAALAAAVDRLAADLVVLSLGPLYPLASLLAYAPGLATRVRSVVAMAGNFASAGDVPRRADFNVWFDPHSARAVFESGLEITLLPRNACTSCVLDAATLGQVDTSEPWAAQLVADLVGMMAQHGADLPLIDAIVPLLLVEPALVRTCRTGTVHVRRRPLRSSGQTYFRETAGGNVRLIDELDADRVRGSLVRRITALSRYGSTYPAHPQASDFRVRSMLHQRLLDRPFHRIEVEPPRAGDNHVISALDLDELDALYRDLRSHVSAPHGPRCATVGGYRDLTTDLPPALSHLGQDAALLAHLVQVDAMAVCVEAGAIRGFACLAVPEAWRCLELGRRLGARVRPGDAVIELAWSAPGAGDELLATTRGALVAFWEQACVRRGVRPGRLHSRVELAS